MQKNNLSSISILGCGWLGLPLAEVLLTQGFSVKGATTSPNKVSLLREKGIVPFLTTLADVQSHPNFFEVDCLVVTVPPGKSPHYFAEIQALIPLIPEKTKVIYTSSTSVYPELNRIVTELDASTAAQTRSGISLFEVENLFPKNQTTILRLAGLIGPDRHPGGFFKGKREISGGNAPINMVHQEDVIRAILWVIQKELWGEVFNVCYPIHPKKMDYYPKMAEQLGLEAPIFDPAETPWKIVSSEKLEKTGFEFERGIDP